MHILVTGVAGFIGFHLANRLLQEGYRVSGIDNCNDYYDVLLKENRIAELQKLPNARDFTFYRVDLADKDKISEIFSRNKFTHVVNLAAQAGVRYSVINPHTYITSNVLGFENILEGCRRHPVEHLVFASSSSVYGLNERRPYSVDDNVDHPISLYAATKKSNELMAHAYSHLFGLPATGLRFFTVYGPWGRPDMALFLFTSSILRGIPIKVFNHGHLWRDFTYIDDIIEGVVRALFRPPHPSPATHPLTPSTSHAPWRIYTHGNNKPVEVLSFIEVLEEALGKKATKELLPMQPGDVEATWADIDSFTAETGFVPTTPLEEGIRRFVAWYRSYYKL